MKKYIYWFLLTITALAVVGLVGIAFEAAILRPASNYHFVPGRLPDMVLPDCFVSCFCMLAAIPVCFTGSLLIYLLDYDEKKES